MSVENIYDIKIFVKNFSFRDDVTDPGQITLDIHFGKEVCPIEASVTDFSDFSKGACFTRTETSDDLIAKLEATPLKIVLKKFLSAEEFGYTDISWPKEFLTKLKGPDFKHIYENNSLYVIKNYEEEEVGDIVVFLAIKSTMTTQEDTEIPKVKGKTLISYEKFEAEEILYSLENFLETNSEDDKEKYVVNNGMLYKCGAPPLPKNLSTIKEVNELRTTLPYKCICDQNHSKQDSFFEKSSYLKSHRPEFLQRPSSLNIKPEDLMRTWCNKIKEDSPGRPKTVGCSSDLNQKKLKVKEKKISKTKLENEFQLNKICIKKLKSLEEKSPKPPKLCSEEPKLKRKYSYKFGKKHPGVVLGHRNCIGYGGPVPHNMGWLWNVQIPGIEKVRKGWRPGAVKKPIKDLMCYFLEPCPCDTLPVTKKILKKRFPFKETSNKLVSKPTLRIQRKDGNLFVTMNPIKNSVDLKNSPDPYLNCKPIHFQISQDPNILKRSHIKKEIKKCGFRRCVCNKTIAQCICKNDDEKIAINEKLNLFSAVFNAERFMKARNRSANINSTEINKLKILFERSKCDSSAIRALKSVLVKGKLGAFIREVIGENKLNELLHQHKFNEIFASVNLNELTDCGKPNKFGEEIKLNDPTTTDESELDIEFTPPVGFIRPGLKKKKYDRVFQETQYDEKDFQLSKIPKLNEVIDGKTNLKGKNVEKSGPKKSAGKKVKGKLANPENKTEMETIKIGGKNSKNLKINPTDKKTVSGPTNSKIIAKNNPTDKKLVAGQNNPKISSNNNPTDKNLVAGTNKNNPTIPGPTNNSTKAGTSRKIK